MAGVFENDKNIVAYGAAVGFYHNNNKESSKLIGRCIGSVLGQSYHNIEHIVVDGASDDNTGDVIASFVDDRLKYLKLDSNWSLEKTYKYGTSNAKGKYICFLDSDDEYLPTKIEKQVELIDLSVLHYWYSSPFTTMPILTGMCSILPRAALRI